MRLSERLTQPHATMTGFLAGHPPRGAIKRGFVFLFRES